MFCINEIETVPHTGHREIACYSLPETSALNWVLVEKRMSVKHLTGFLVLCLCLPAVLATPVGAWDALGEPLMVTPATLGSFLQTLKEP